MSRQGVSSFTLSGASTVVSLGKACAQDARSRVAPVESTIASRAAPLLQAGTPIVTSRGESLEYVRQFETEALDRPGGAALPAPPLHVENVGEDCSVERASLQPGATLLPRPLYCLGGGMLSALGFLRLVSGDPSPLDTRRSYRQFSNSPGLGLRIHFFCIGLR